MTDESLRSGAAKSGPEDDARVAQSTFPKMVHDLRAPEVFASTMTGAGFEANRSVLRMTFASQRATFEMDGQNQSHMVENLRLVMPAADVRVMAQFLLRMLDSQDLAQAAPPPGTPVQ